MQLAKNFNEPSDGGYEKTVGFESYELVSATDIELVVSTVLCTPSASNPLARFYGMTSTC